MASTRGRQVVIPLTNKSGGSVAAGDVVISDASNDTSFTTTTTGRYEGVVGIAQETIASNATGRVLIAGHAALVNVPASVTRGHYIETHTVVKQATGSATRRSGSLGVFLTGGTTPTALLGGLPDQTASGGAVTFMGCRVYNSTTQSITTGSFQAVTFDTEEYDTDAIHDTGSNTSRLVVPAASGGKWICTAHVKWDTNTTNTRYIAFRLNGTTNIRSAMTNGVGISAGIGLMASTGPIALSAGDYIEVMVFQDSGGTRTIGDASVLYQMSGASFWKCG